MSIFQQIQVGVDIATAISILGATTTFWNNQRKESEKARKQRLSESGSKVIIDDIHSLAASFNLVLKEYREVYFKNFRQVKNEEESYFLKRFYFCFLNEEISSDFDKEFNEFMKVFSTELEFVGSKRYSIIPVIGAIEVGDKKELVNKINELPLKLSNMYNQLLHFRNLWRELKKIYHKRKEFKDVSSWKDILEERNINPDYDDYDTLIQRISFDDDYMQYLDADFLSKQEFLENYEGSSELEDEKKEYSYKLYKIQHLYSIIDNEENFAALCHNVISEASLLAQNCMTEYKRILCTLSAIYSYILNDCESLDNEIKKYEEIFKLEEILI